MHAGSAPERIGEAHPADQPPNFRRYLGPAGTPTRFPTPEGAKPSSMPAENGLRPNHRKCIQDTRCNPVQADRKGDGQNYIGRGVWARSVQHVQLMTQNQVLCLERSSRSDEAEEHPPDQVEQVPHGPVSWPDSWPQAKWMGFATGTAMCCALTRVTTMASEHTCRWPRTRPYPDASRRSGAFFRGRSSEDCTTITSGFNWR